MFMCVPGKCPQCNSGSRPQILQSSNLIQQEVQLDAQSLLFNQNHKLNLKLTLTQSCPQECFKVTSAFRCQSIHWILQFTMVIALRSAAQLPAFKPLVCLRVCTQTQWTYISNNRCFTSPETHDISKMVVDTGWCSVDRSTMATFITYTTWVELSRLPMPHQTQATVLCVAPHIFDNTRDICNLTI